MLKQFWNGGSLSVGLVIVANSAAFAGDFSNPVPYSADQNRAQIEAAERTRLSLGSGSGPSFVTMGDYYERYQNGANWNNAILAGNTIILNGDNNTVTLTTDGSTVTQTSDGICQTTSNTFLNDGGTSTGATTECDTDE